MQLVGAAKQKSGRRKTQLLAVDPVESANGARLRYVRDSVPGIRRERIGKGFRYVGPEGKTIKDQAEIRRIKALVIPPAWTDVWICPTADGHVQATGRDVKRRKQYRYHRRWHEVRDETKYNRMVVFGESLPVIRKRVDEDLALPNLPRQKVLAAVVRLLEATRIRIGNEEYARANGSFGLTTLRNHHVDVFGSTLRFQFRGKSKKPHSVKISDRRLARIVKRCQDIPGYELFQYLDKNNKPQSIDSADVNNYLREITKEDFTAKDFRTWAGTVLAADALQQNGSSGSTTPAKKTVVNAIKAVAEQLGNTVAICRKCYIHPAVVEAYMDGSLPRCTNSSIRKTPLRSNGLLPEEKLVLSFLRRRLKQKERTNNG